jgi:hypothetical protein
MRWLVGGTTVLLLTGPGGAHADPGAPLLSPLRRQREDAQRLHEQQRESQHERPPQAAPAPAPPPGPDSAVPARHESRSAGVALLGIAGVSGVLALSLFIGDAGAESAPGESGSSLGTWSSVFGATAAVSGFAGLVLVLSHRSGSAVQVAPAVGPRAAGLTIRVRL